MTSNHPGRRPAAGRARKRAARAHQAATGAPYAAARRAAGPAPSGEAPTYDEIANNVVGELPEAINALAQRFEQYREAPAEWPALLAEVSEIAGSLYDHCQDTAQQLADYHAVHPRGELDDNPAVMILPPGEHAELADEDDDEYGQAVYAEHGTEPGMSVRVERVDQDGRVVILARPGAAGRLVTLWYGGAERDAIAADLEARGIEPGRPPIVPKPAGTFFSVGSGLYDQYGRAVEEGATA